MIKGNLPGSLEEEPKEKEEFACLKLKIRGVGEYQEFRDDVMRESVDIHQVNEEGDIELAS